MTGKKAVRKKTGRKVPEGIASPERSEGIDPFLGPESVPDGWVEMREFLWLDYARKEHGERRVRKAYDWLEALIRKKDPRAREIYAEVMAGPNPYGVLVGLARQDRPAK